MNSHDCPCIKKQTGGDVCSYTVGASAGNPSPYLGITVNLHTEGKRLAHNLPLCISHAPSLSQGEHASLCPNDSLPAMTAPPHRLSASNARPLPLYVPLWHSSR